MPTLLKIYSNHQTNKLVTTTIEYAVKQFYLMNRKPFILQMFGSVSAVLDTDEDGTYGDAHKVRKHMKYFVKIRAFSGTYIFNNFRYNRVVSSTYY